MVPRIQQLHDVPMGNVVLLVGPPGCGKTTFCQQVILQNLGLERPVMYLTTEYGTSDGEKALKERGLTEIEPGLLSFVNAYHETVGLPVADRADSVHAHCEDLSSIGIAITKLGERLGRKGALLVFDSLTSPYLFSGAEILKFLRMTLSGFAAEGNSVLACIDEGCGKPEDLVAMMSISNGVVKMETEGGRRVLNVVKHPVVEPTRMEVPGASPPDRLFDMKTWQEEIMDFPLRAMQGGAMAEVRGGLGNFVNLFWSNFARWSCILWDPKRFPEMAYEMSKRHGEAMKETMSVAPWHQRAMFRFAMPKSFSSVRDMGKMGKVYGRMTKGMGMGTVEYDEDASRTDEHYFRIRDCPDCCGFENVGAPMAYLFPPGAAGMCKGIESWRGLERDWNAVETMCVGLGDPYCEWKLVPGEIPELRASLVKDSTVLEGMHDRLMGRLMGFLLEGKPLVERPGLGGDEMISSILHVLVQPALAGERYRVVMRMAGAKAGKEVGEHLLEAGVEGDDAVNRVLDFLEYCKVGKATAGDTIRMEESCESIFYKFMTKKRQEPCCYYTTGFVNGFFSTIKDQHVRETRCIAMGDPYCEWEFG